MKCTLCASLIDVASLIFNAKENPFGQLLMVIFSMLYRVISYSFSYYGEMITYLGMTMPMAVFTLISWLRNPYKGNKAEVKVNSLTSRENIFMWISTVVITIIKTKQLAAICGFQDSSYFCKAYKKKYSTTPSKML